jgi:predicted transcriptional regulator
MPMSTLTAPTPKQQARELIDALPDDATWTELPYRLEVRADIEEGLADVKAGRLVSTAELRREFNLPE